MYAYTGMPEYQCYHQYKNVLGLECYHNMLISRCSCFQLYSEVSSYLVVFEIFYQESSLEPLTYSVSELKRDGFGEEILKEILDDA